MADNSPVFCRVPVFPGSIALWHFPSRRHLIHAANSGCNVVVTLQGISEDSNIVLIKETCVTLGLEWIQIDFWKNYYQHANSEGHPALIRLVEDLASRICKGQRILIHCAAGIHRTGMCVYSVLRKLGLDPAATLECIKQIRRATFERCGMRRFSDMESNCKTWFKVS